MNNEESSDDRLERIRRHWQLGFAIGSPNSDMRKIQDDFCFVLRLLDQKRSTPPAPAMPEMTDAMLAERVWSGDRWTYPNLTTLRQRLAEAEKSRDTARGVADAFRDTISRATRNPDAVHGLMMLCESHEKHAKCEAEKARLVSAMTKENERVAADAARWEGAARVCEALVGACEECIKNSVGYDDDEWAIELPITYGMIRSARAAITTASALVREGGGHS